MKFDDVNEGYPQFSGSRIIYSPEKIIQRWRSFQIFVTGAEMVNPNQKLFSVPQCLFWLSIYILERKVYNKRNAISKTMKEPWSNYTPKFRGQPEHHATQLYKVWRKSLLSLIHNNILTLIYSLYLFEVRKWHQVLGNFLRSVSK